MASIGTNVEVKEEKGKLTITVDLGKTFGNSKSGKSTIIASTQGNARLTAIGKPEVIIGVNVYRKSEKE